MASQRKAAVPGLGLHGKRRSDLFRILWGHPRRRSVLEWPEGRHAGVILGPLREVKMKIPVTQLAGFGSLSPLWRKPVPAKGARPEYTPAHARGGAKASLPEIETGPNQYRRYEITITVPEYTSICPRTDLPDFGTITIHYLPHKLCLELRSLKYYVLAYRNPGIFCENAVNRILANAARSCCPKWMVVRGEFTTRGGMRTIVEARLPRRR